MTRKGSLGWIMLLVAMAVPAFIFYNWWSGLNSARRREMAKKVRLRIPEDKLFSGSSRPVARLTNPIASQGSALPVASTASAAVEAVVAPVPPPVEPAGAAPKPEPDRFATAAPPAVAQPHFRDPTLSPYDQYRLEQLELEKKIREQEMRFPSRSRAQPRDEGKSVESAVSLEGIVINEESGNRAIVNGETVSEGDFVGKVKVQRITPRGVLFLYKNKKFMKWMSQ